jgi:hypothetical protein
MEYVGNGPHMLIDMHIDVLFAETRDSSVRGMVLMKLRLLPSFQGECGFSF